jgi:uncharacterized protein YneF (UPF0154 family)
MMIDLIIKMTFCLIIALILGFFIGSMLSRTFLKKKHKIEVDELNRRLFEYREEIEKQVEIQVEIQVNKEKGIKENHLENKKNKSVLLAKEKLLDKKSKEVWKLQKELKISENSLKENLNEKEYNQSLIEQIIELEEKEEKHQKEMQGLEKVLIKAETMIEGRDTLITRLQEELKEEKETEELLITKDQFTQIEAQLIEYQREILRLKTMNKDLTKSDNEKSSIEIKEIHSELDDSAIVKLFGDTYKKIIKP